MIGVIKKLLTAGAKKKPMAKRTAPRDQGKLNKANESAARDTEILTLERLINRTKNESTKNALRKKLMRLKMKSRDGKKAPEKAKKPVKQREKPMAKDLQTPAFLKRQAGVLDSEVKEGVEKMEKNNEIPNFLKKQAM